MRMDKKTKVGSGSLSFLKDWKDVKIEFSYDDMRVGKFPSETDYINKRVQEENDKEAGKGEEWKTKWNNSKSERYEPKFIELFNKYTEGKLTVDKSADASHVISVNTTFIEPGWNVGVMRSPSYTNLTITFYENSDPKKELAKISIEKSPGSDAMGFDFDAGYRISESYAKAGKAMAQYLVKKAL
jgi:hypothetical protein